MQLVSFNKNQNKITCLWLNDLEMNIIVLTLLFSEIIAKHKMYHFLLN